MHYCLEFGGILEEFPEVGEGMDTHLVAAAPVERQDAESGILLVEVYVPAFGGHDNYIGHSP